MSAATLKSEAKRLLDGLPEGDVAEVIRFARWLTGEEAEELTPSEYAALDRGIAQARAGKVKPWREVRRKAA
jgi:hypothetical protein